LDYLILILTILLSAVFSGLEIAFITADKMRLQIINKRGGLLAKVLNSFISYPSRFIATLLIGNNLALVTFGIYIERILDPKVMLFTDIPILVLLIQTVISTVIILLFAEYIPKTIFRIKPNYTLRFFAFPMFLIFWGLKWVVNIVVGFSKFLLKKFLKVDIQEGRPIIGRLELQQYLEKRVENIDNVEDLDAEVQYYKNVLDFQSVRVRECMVPRTEIIAMEKNCKINKLIELFSSKGISKIPIYNNNIDDIIGYVHAFEMLKKPKTIKNILLPIELIPETIPINEALNRLKVKQKSLAVVIDEYGGTSGILTVEDIVEELFGEIEDEHDLVDHHEVKIDKGKYEFSARLEVNFINEKYGINLPCDEDYDTLGGLVVHNTEDIPKKNDLVELEHFIFTILEVSSTKIEKIGVEIRHSNQ